MMPMRRHVARVMLASVVLVAPLLAGCVSKGESAPPAEKLPFRAADFTAPGKAVNKWLPLTPGMQWTRVGRTDIGFRSVPHQVVATVTRVTRQVDGVTAIAVVDQDVDAGQLAQYSVDYEAQDRAGNVWLLGSYTETYEGGRFASVLDAWLGGVNGGQPGRLMTTRPAVGDKPYSVAQAPGADADVAQVVQQHQHQCVPLRCFDDVLVTREGTASAPNDELKYYAPGVGQILSTPQSDSHGRDFEELVNVTRLTPHGLDQVDAKVLELDAHARVTKPEIFGTSAPAKRTL
jgi:hypothetical protein